MPITPAYQWQESLAWISIDVKIPNVRASSADILTTECYAKVNSPPYFFEVDLYQEVDAQKSKATIGENVVRFFFVKREEQLWERLALLGDRQTRLDRRAKSLVAIRKQHEKSKKEYPAKFSNIGRLAVGEHMKMEEMKLKTIEQRKETENMMEQHNIELWKKDMWSTLSENKVQYPNPEETEKRNLLGKKYDIKGQNQCPTTNRAALALSDMDLSMNKPDTEQVPNLETHMGTNTLQNLNTPEIKRDDRGTEDKKPKDEPLTENGCRNIMHNDTDGHDLRSNNSSSNDITLTHARSDSKIFANGEVLESRRYCGPILPPPRNNSTVMVNFNPKPNLPQHLPARESRTKEIKLKKSEQICKEALDVSERAPLFLQDKGDKFFKAGDYQSAIHAYTDALVKDPSLIISLANRAACNLYLKDYQACIDDCTKSMSMLASPTDTKSKSKSPHISPQVLASTLDTIPTDKEQLMDKISKINFSTKSLELFTCLSGQGCCSMRGLSVEGAGVEEWKLFMKKHVLLRRGVAELKSGNLRKAIDDFTKAVQIKPVNEEAQNVLSQLQSMMDST